MHSLNAEPRACVGRTPVNGENTMRHISLLLCSCVAAAAFPGCAPPTGHPPRNDDRRVETTCKWLVDADPEVRVRAAVTLEVLGPRAHAAAACLARSVRDPVEAVRIASVDALGKIQGD